MPGAVAPFLAYEASLADNTLSTVKLDFPLLTVTGEKAIVNEIIGFDWDPGVDAGDIIDSTTSAAQQTKATVVLSKRELSTAEVVTYTTKIGPGNTSVIGKATYVNKAAILDTDATSVPQVSQSAASAFPWYISLIRGETGYILPQEFLWLNLYQSNPTTGARMQSVRIYFYQRSLPAKNYLTLLQNDIQLS